MGMQGSVKPEGAPPPFWRARSSGWQASGQPLAYAPVADAMERHVNALVAGDASETFWFLEHTPVFTAGTSAKPQDLLAPERFPVIKTGRGGQYTYHGPGQRIVYVMLDLRERQRDVRLFVETLEQAVIDTLAAFNIRGERRQGRVGIWVPRPDKGAGAEDKIAAIGIRMRRWVSFHGLSLNIAPDLEHFSGIVPCGVSDQGVTSFEDLGHLVAMADVDLVLRDALAAHFGPIAEVPEPLAL